MTPKSVNGEGCCDKEFHKNVVRLCAKYIVSLQFTTLLLNYQLNRGYLSDLMYYSSNNHPSKNITSAHTHASPHLEMR